MRPPVPLLLARPLRPETTPSGTAAAISQYPICLPHLVYLTYRVPSVCLAYGYLRGVNVFCTPVLNPSSCRMICVAQAVTEPMRHSVQYQMANTI